MTEKNRLPGAKILSVLIALGTALCVWGICMFLVSCGSSASVPPRVFLDVSLEFLGDYQLPKGAKVDDVPVGGLSGLTFDRQQQVFYAVSDDRGAQGASRFYTVKPILDATSRLQSVEIQKMTTFKGADGQTFPVGSLDPEAIAVTPNHSVLISSEGDRRQNIPPLVGEFDLQTGQLKHQIRLPERYLPDADGLRGVQNNLAFESLTLAPFGSGGEPLQMFAATEAPLVQDRETVTKEQPQWKAQNRWLHYLIGDGETPLAEYVYSLEQPPVGTLEHGLSEIQALDNNGHFLAVERSLGLMGFKIKIFQAATGGATDVSSVKSLVGYTGTANIQKQLVLDLDSLKIKLDNIEGMAIGPQLPDGSASLLLVSDNNFNRLEITQFLWFRLRVV